MTNFNIPLLYQNQSMKEITINEMINKITYLMNKVASETVKQLPKNPENQLLILIAEKPDEDLLLHANHMTIFINGSWEFIPPHQGLIIFNMELRKFMVFRKEKWEKLTEVM